MGTKKTLPKVCHCGSGKLPGIMRTTGWCCGECYNDRRQCLGPVEPVPYVEVSVISEYGLTQKLSNAIRVF